MKKEIVRIQLNSNDLEKIRKRAERYQVVARNLAVSISGACAVGLGCLCMSGESRVFLAIWDTMPV
jgi:hypothetical protein